MSRKILKNFSLNILSPAVHPRRPGQELATAIYRALTSGKRVVRISGGRPFRPGLSICSPSSGALMHRSELRRIVRVEAGPGRQHAAQHQTQYGTHGYRR